MGPLLRVFYDNGETIPFVTRPARYHKNPPRMDRTRSSQLSGHATSTRPQGGYGVEQSVIDGSREPFTDRTVACQGRRCS